MKQFYIGCLFFIFFPIFVFGQSLFENSITGTNPNLLNPYTIGQIVDPNITVSGIGIGAGLFVVNATDRYNAKSWSLVGLDSNAYFEFIITPNTDKKIDFISFVYTGQISDNGPTSFAFRSSVDGFTSDIGSVTATGTTVSLSGAEFQNIVTPITFRLYGWSAPAGTGTFSINDFQFNGVVSCVAPQTPILIAPSFGCSSTSFGLDWSVCSNSNNYFIDIATDSDFINYLTDYQNKPLGNVLSETVNGLKAGGTYYVRLKSDNGCLTSDFSNTIKVAPPETVYNGTWSNGSPDATKNVRFSSNYNGSASFEACSCQIDDNVAIHVDSGEVLKLQNGLDVIGSGTITFGNNASLVQVNDDAVNTGKIIYKRITSPMKNFDYTYWSSPVKDQVLNVLSPNTLSDKYFSFDNGNWVYENGSNTMNPAGKGFIIRVPKPGIGYSNGEYWTGATYLQPVQFEGVPYNGVIMIASQGDGKDNLIGNPYPSAIDADAFINANSTLIGGALNFWTHNTAIKQDGSFYVYSSDDYASYTLTGGIVTSLQAPSTGSSGTRPNGKIAAGQSFFVTSKAIGNFVFNNSMRISDPGSNSQFFRMSQTQKVTSIEKNRVWLNFANSEGAFKQLLVGYVTGATNEMDDLYDGISFDGNTYVDFYSINKENKLAIQGRALSSEKKDQVPIGYKTTIDGIFEIKIDHVDGSLAKHDIYLEDKNIGILHDLKKSPYSFSTSKGEYNNRFVLSYTVNNKSENEHEIVENTQKDFQVYVQENRLNLKSGAGNITSVFIYDLKGELLYQKKKIDKELFVVTDLIPKHQVLIIKAVFDNAVNRTSKAVF